MSEKQVKFGFDVPLFLGIFFSCFGLVYTLVAFILEQVRAPGAAQIIMWVFGGIGIAFLIPGAILLGRAMNRRNAIRRAVESGNCIMATITQTVCKTNVRINGVHPWMVECATQDQTGMDIYHSQYLKHVPPKEVIGCEVPVYLCPENPRWYYVDLSEVLPEVRVH